MARENRLWAWLSKVKETPRLAIERCENAVSTGTPDVTVCYEGASAFIELKSAARPKRATTPVRFPTRDGQVDWHTAWWEAGASTWWLVQVGQGHERSIYMLAGHWGEQLHKGMTELDLAAVSVLRSPKPSPMEVIVKARRAVDIARW